MGKLLPLRECAGFDLPTRIFLPCCNSATITLPSRYIQPRIRYQDQLGLHCLPEWKLL